MNTMIAMQIDAPGGTLRRIERELRHPLPDELLIEVTACGACRTDLHVLDDDIPARCQPRRRMRLEAIISVATVALALRQ